MIEIEDICSFIDGHSCPMVELRLVLNVGYVQRVGIVYEDEEKVDIKAFCLKVSSPEDCSINLRL